MTTVYILIAIIGFVAVFALFLAIATAAILDAVWKYIKQRDGL